jgi:hypothetical protein
VVVHYPSVILQGFLEWQAHVVGFIKACIEERMFSDCFSSPFLPLPVEETNQYFHKIKLIEGENYKLYSVRSQMDVI